MRGSIVLAALLLGACGGGSSNTKVEDGKTLTVESGDAKVQTGPTVDCSAKPDFAPVHANSTISVCASAPVEATGRISGSLIYTNAAAPAAILAWSKAQALGGGFKLNFETEKTFSARADDQRSLVVITEPEGSGSRVTVNWGKQP